MQNNTQAARMLLGEDRRVLEEWGASDNGVLAPVLKSVMCQVQRFQEYIEGGAWDNELDQSFFSGSLGRVVSAYVNLRYDVIALDVKECASTKLPYIDRPLSVDKSGLEPRGVRSSLVPSSMRALTTVEVTLPSDPGRDWREVEQRCRSSIAILTHIIHSVNGDAGGGPAIRSEDLRLLDLNSLFKFVMPDQGGPVIDEDNASGRGWHRYANISFPVRKPMPGIERQTSPDYSQATPPAVELPGGQLNPRYVEWAFGQTLEKEFADYQGKTGRKPKRVERLWNKFRGHEGEMISLDELAKDYIGTSSPRTRASEAVSWLNGIFKRLHLEIEVASSTFYFLRRKPRE